MLLVKQDSLRGEKAEGTWENVPGEWTHKKQK